MAYTEDKKSTGLDVLTGLDAGDLHIVGDISDSGRGKAITQNDLETTIANSSNFINELTSNNIFQSAVNSFVTGGTGLGQIYIDQTPDNGNYGLLAGSLDGVNKVFTVSQGEYVIGKIAVYLNGEIQEQGVAKDFTESDASNGEITFTVAPASIDVVTVVYTTTAATVDNYTVKATTADTTPSFLDDKISVISSDSSVSITKTVNNPAGNEDIEYDLSVDVSGIAASLYPTLIPTGTWTTANTSDQTTMCIGNYFSKSGTIYSVGSYGKAVDGNVSVIPSTANGVCHDYSIDKFFTSTVTSTGGGNYTLDIKMYDIATPNTVEATWTCSGFSSVTLPTAASLNMVVDFDDLKVFITTQTLTGSNTLDTTSLGNNTTYVFDLSSASGGTIDGTAVSFSGGAKFPVLGTNPALINSTTKKFITAAADNKYTYDIATGITATNAINFGKYSGRNVVMSTGILYKVNVISASGGTVGISTIYNDFIEMYPVPTSNTILNT